MKKPRSKRPIINLGIPSDIEEAADDGEGSPLQVTVRLFAVARQRVGRPEVTVELSESATVGELRQSLAASYPELAPILPNLMFAVSTEYATEETPIPPGAEVAAIPPVSGGWTFAWK